MLRTRLSRLRIDHMLGGNKHHFSFVGPRCLASSQRALSYVSASMLNTLPQHYSIDSLWPELKTAVNEDTKSLVVLDDDPTGCQTAYDVNVLLDYSLSTLIEQFKKNEKLFYIITNTRAMNAAEASQLTEELTTKIHLAASMTSRYEVQLISRGDSTLRGHFPLEVGCISSSYPLMYDGVILAPAFFDGGRVTINDIHYLQDGDKLIPVAETAFAKDPHFGYKHSDLKQWVKDKYNNESMPLVSISIEDIRQGGPLVIANKLENLVSNSVVIVNAVNQHDLNTFMLGLLKAERHGDVRFIYQSAASFVSTRAGLEPRGLLSYDSIFAGASTSSSSNSNNSSTSRLNSRAGDNSVTHGSNSAAATKTKNNNSNNSYWPNMTTARTSAAPGSPARSGGLIVVGSYVPKTTAQLSNLFNSLKTENLLVDASKVIALAKKNIPSQPNEEMQSLISSNAAKIDELIASGTDVVLYTSREFSTGAELSDTAIVSKTITDIMSKLTSKPHFIVSKGGITSFEVARSGLGVKIAKVLGQIEPGVPVWRLDKDSKFPGVPYVVFPGNVGNDEALSRVAKRLGVQESSNLASNKGKSPKPLVIGDYRDRWVGKEGMLAVLRSARDSEVAIPAFNIYNMEGARAVVSAAEECNSPVILQVHPAALAVGGVPLLALLNSFRRHASVQVLVHLDHAVPADEQRIYQAIAGGVDSIMVDGSALPLEDNIRWTAFMVRAAHSVGVSVEGELGRLTGEEDGTVVHARDAKMTDPVDAVSFVARTGVDMLAVTIGNVHGEYRSAPVLDFNRLAKIGYNLHHAGFDVPLVLHGASGLPKELIHQSIKFGITKFNVNTDLRTAASNELRQIFESKNEKIEYVNVLKRTTEAMREVAVDKFKLFTPN